MTLPADTLCSETTSEENSGMSEDHLQKLLAAVLTVASFAGKTGGADANEAVDRYHEIHRLLHDAEQRAKPVDPAPKEPFGGVRT